MTRYTVKSGLISIHKTENSSARSITINIGSDRIKATGGHPFWVINENDLENRPLCNCLPCTEQNLTPYGRWVYARDLQIGDVIQSRVKESCRITDLTIETSETLVYNFLVDDLHNYAVSQNEVLVHNTNSPKKFDDIPDNQRAFVKKIF
jgi:hypothetical protein